MPESDGWVSIPAKPETKDHVTSLKRGGESYDELLRKMADAYEPDS